MRFWVGILLLLITSTVQAVSDDAVLTLLNSRCVKCHGKDGKVKGKINLLNIKMTAKLSEDLEMLQMILNVLDEGEMPPEEETPLKPAVRAEAVAALKDILRDAAADSGYAPIPIRRMNRLQYNNAVKDLFELKVSVFPLPEKMMRDRSGYFAKALGGEVRKMPKTVTVSSRPLGKSGLIEPRLAGVGPFPQDPRAEHGFDNRGDHLSLSPILLEAFFKLSRRILESPNFDRLTVGIWGDYFLEPEEVEIKNAVRKRLRRFMTRAFRRPLDEALLNRYAQHVFRQIEAGMSFTGAMKEAASAVLSSPRFLYLYNQSAVTGKTESIDGYDLASRMSFFLWGSIPDDELLQLAGKGDLAKPTVLKEQVNRMLASPKLKRFCDSFPSQWLQLDRIVSAVPDEIKYKDFFFAAPNYRTTMDMMIEPLLLFETVLIENRSILEFIDSSYTYRSGRLRNWYGDVPTGKIGGPVTMQFTRQPVADRRQGGMITNAAVMTMTSGPEETKPITRGAWIAGVIFNAPPEPPPANVPPLGKSKLEEKNLTVRERFVAHRERTDCAGCHAKIDPLGFALENFDPVGRWRNSYENGRLVDVSGVLFRKHTFTNLVEFKDALLAEKDRFTRAFAGHMLSYALSRGLTPADSFVLDRITKKTIDGGYRLQTLINEVVQSPPFVGRSSSELVSAKLQKNDIQLNQ